MSKTEKLKKYLKGIIQSRRNANEFPPYDLPKDHNTEDYIKLATQLGHNDSKDFEEILQFIEKKIEEEANVEALLNYVQYFDGVFESWQEESEYNEESNN